jgi:flagellar basal-body rod modification protein FlgD
VSILKEDGSVVYTETLGSRGPGFGEFTWDGMDANGDPAKAGTYQIRVTQKGADGDSQNGVTFITETVTGVRFTDGITYLLLGEQRVALSDVLEINAPGTSFNG